MSFLFDLICTRLYPIIVKSPFSINAAMIGQADVKQQSLNGSGSVRVHDGAPRPNPYIPTFEEGAIFAGVMGLYGIRLAAKLLEED